MALLICGTTALDDIIIKNTEYKNQIGGSAFHASMASRFFTKTYVSGRVGNDFSNTELNIFKNLNIDLSYLEIDKEKPTFHWTGEYLENFNDRITKNLVIGGWENYNCKIPENKSDINILLLANMSPVHQINIMNNFPYAFKIMDTMNFYIDTEYDKLIEAISKTDMLVINDEEYKMLTDIKDPDKAAKEMLNKFNNLRYLIIKQGSHGARLYTKNKMFTIPACPVDKVNDPTGAGDSFVGALAGFLDKQQKIDFKTMKLAMFYATVAASFNVEGVSISTISKASYDDIEKRVEFLKSITQLD